MQSPKSMSGDPACLVTISVFLIHLV